MKLTYLALCISLGCAIVLALHESPGEHSSSSSEKALDATSPAKAIPGQGAPLAAPIVPTMHSVVHPSGSHSALENERAWTEFRLHRDALQPKEWQAAMKLKENRDAERRALTHDLRQPALTADTRACLTEKLRQLDRLEPTDGRQTHGLVLGSAPALKATLARQQAQRGRDARRARLRESAQFFEALRLRQPWQRTVFLAPRGIETYSSEQLHQMVQTLTGAPHHEGFDASYLPHSEDARPRSYEETDDERFQHNLMRTFRELDEKEEKSRITSWW